MILQELLNVISDDQQIYLTKLSKNFWGSLEYIATKKDIVENKMWLDKEVKNVMVRKFNSHNVDWSHPPFNAADLAIWVKE